MQREGKIKQLAFASSLQVIVDNILSAILAIFGFGVWSIVLPKILVAPIWLLICRYGHPWRPHGGFSMKHLRAIWDYCRGFLGGEMFTTLQVNVDNILVGLFLSINDLGLYYFAFNAGLGITMGLVNSFTVAVFPHLCAVQENNTSLRKNYLQAIKTISYLVVPLVVAQTLLAPIYVPLLFGHKWLSAIPILMIICASALPRAFALGASQLLRAIGKTDLDMKWQAISTVVLIVSLLIGLQFGIMGVAWAVLISQILVSVPFGLLSIYRFIKIA
jgi:PST family polysaccharide transporter